MGLEDTQWHRRFFDFEHSRFQPHEKEEKMVQTRSMNSRTTTTSTTTTINTSNSNTTLTTTTTVSTETTTTEISTETTTTEGSTRERGRSQRSQREHGTIIQLFKSLRKL